MTDYINKVDLLLDIADLPNNASKKDILKVVYEQPVSEPITSEPITIVKNAPAWIGISEKVPNQEQLAVIYTPARPNLYRVGRYTIPPHKLGLSDEPYWRCGTTSLEGRWVTHWLPIPEKFYFK